MPKLARDLVAAIIPTVEGVQPWRPATGSTIPLFRQGKGD